MKDNSRYFVQKYVKSLFLGIYIFFLVNVCLCTCVHYALDKRNYFFDMDVASTSSSSPLYPHPHPQTNQNIKNCSWDKCRNNLWQTRKQFHPCKPSFRISKTSSKRNHRFVSSTTRQNTNAEHTPTQTTLLIVVLPETHWIHWMVSKICVVCMYFDVLLVFITLDRAVGPIIEPPATSWNAYEGIELHSRSGEKRRNIS